MKLKNQFTYYSRIVFTVIVYLIFFGFVITNIINAKDNSTRIFNILILLFFGTFSTLFEFLRINYDAATKRLIVDDKPQEALDLIRRVKKYDLFKTFKTSTQMLEMLSLMDLRRFDELKKYVDELEKSGNTDYDVEILMRYCQMIAYGETNNKGKSNDAYKKLINVRDMVDKKGRRRKGAYFFNWGVVNGQHKNYEGDYQGAYKYLKDVEEANMNKREVVWYLLAKLVACKNTKDTKTYNEIKERLSKLVINNEEMKTYIETM